MPDSLVSVVCLCFNQKRFLREAVESVLSQTYRNVELIIVDDASTDGSKEEILKIKDEHPAVTILLLDENQGNCKAFNRGLALAKGDYLIDLAADDILLPQRVATGVKALQSAGNDYGVNFSDAIWIDEAGKKLYQHSERFPHQTIPQGDVYTEVIQRYFICPPTVMFTRAVMDTLGGYDETLTYEDFDFWIRSSRFFKYCYSTDVLVKKRVVRNGQSNVQFTFFSKHSISTYKVCEKIFSLNKSREEQLALARRIRYEIKLNLRLLNIPVVLRYLKLWKRNKGMIYP